jgi:stage II sporulation protein D
MNRVTQAAVLVLALAHPAEAQADETIRVLLAPDVHAVVVESPGGIMIGDGHGTERAVAGRVVLEAAPAGILVNGVRVQSIHVTCRGRSDELTIRMGSAQSRDSNGMRATPPSQRPADRSQHSSVLRVSGALHLFVHAGLLMVVNELDLEEYVKGVVPGEMNAAWHPEALKTQAVAARTYALYQRMLNLDRPYDLVAGIQDQVYRGRAGVDERVAAAVEETRGLIVTYQNAPILAAFSSTAAGPTEDAMIVWAKDLPYLKGVDCPFDAESPYYQWRAEIPVQLLEQSLRKQGMPVGTIATLTPYRYSRSGRVDKIRILHSEGVLILRGQDLRKAVGYSVVLSTQFEVELFGRLLILAGRGSGHAVGLCQWGAKELAEQGYRFDTILRYYFPDTVLQRAGSTNRTSAIAP